MRILFSHSYYLRFDPKQWKLKQPYAPLATIQAASYIRENHFDVSLHDVMFEHSAKSIAESIQKNKPDVLVMYDDGFNYLTKMCLTNMRDAALEMVSIGKEAGCKVIVSSSDSTDHPKEYLRAGAHFVLLGEAEQTLLELLGAFKNDLNNFDNIHGIAFLKEGEVVKTPPRNVMKQLDILPMPAWDLINFDNYKTAWKKSSGYFSINVYTTRGCPFKCNWCAKPIYGNRYNARTPECVVEEIKHLKEKYQAEHIWFCDDIFGLKPGWVKQFSELMNQQNLKTPFKIQCRADLLLEDNNIELLASAGCDEVWLGAESGSQKILDAMEKGITVEQIYKATENLRKHNIKPCLFIQFGYLGETLQDIRKTIKMIMDLMPHHIGVSVSYPLPGTVFYNNVKEQLKNKSNWKDSDELALMFKNTFAPGFYKTLHRYLHQAFRSKQGLQLLMKIISGKERITKYNLLNALTFPLRYSLKYYHQIKLRQFKPVQ